MTLLEFICTFSDT